MEKLVLGIITTMVGGLLILLVGMMFTDFHYFSNILESKTPAELKTACLDDWYKNSKFESLPAQCRQFYNQGVIIN